MNLKRGLKTSALISVGALGSTVLVTGLTALNFLAEVVLIATTPIWTVAVIIGTPSEEEIEAKEMKRKEQRDDAVNAAIDSMRD